MPAEQGLRPHHERGPDAPRHRPARRREQESVETVESRALHLPMQHLHLVPEHQELDVLLILSATSGSEEAADEEVQEREQHGAPSVEESACYRCRRPRIGEIEPFTLGPRAQFPPARWGPSARSAPRRTRSNRWRGAPRSRRRRRVSRCDLLGLEVHPVEDARADLVGANQVSRSVSACSTCLRTQERPSIVVSTTVLLLPEFLPDLVEDDAVVFSFNDPQPVVRTPRPRTLLGNLKLTEFVCTSGPPIEGGTGDRTPEDRSPCGSVTRRGPPAAPPPPRRLPRAQPGARRSGPRAP